MTASTPLVLEKLDEDGKDSDSESFYTSFRSGDLFYNFSFLKVG